jgi:hypothetical protein
MEATDSTEPPDDARERRAWFRQRMATMATPTDARPQGQLALEELACLAELPPTDPDEKTRELRAFRERLLRR